MKYDYLIILGSAYPNVKDRFQHAIDLVKNGICCDSIVVLSGARPLTESEKNKIQKDFNILDDQVPQTEAQSMIFLYQHMAMPESMRNLPIQIIDVPMKFGAQGQLIRPTTGDTVDAWMDLDPTPGKCLAISNQPYVLYQDSVLKTLLPQSFIVEAVGARDGNMNIDLCLDTLARFLYQEHKRASKK